MNTVDIYIAQEDYARRRAEITNEVRAAQMWQAQIAQQLMPARNWLGTRFIAWGRNLQGQQDATLEWTHW